MFCFTLVTIDNFDYATPAAESLFERIALRPRQYEMETPQKGVRSDMFYTIKADLFNETTTDDNGAYLNSRSNRKQCFIETNEGKVTNIKIVHQKSDGKLYYNIRIGKAILKYTSTTKTISIQQYNICIVHTLVIAIH